MEQFERNKYEMRIKDLEEQVTVSKAYIENQNNSLALSTIVIYIAVIGGALGWIL